MTYSNAFNPAAPTSSDPANVDTDLRLIKAAVNERLNAIFGFNMAVDDPLILTKIGPYITLTTKNAHPTTCYDNGTVVLGTVTIDYKNGNDQKVTLGSNTTITMTAGTVVGQSMLLDVIYGGAYTTSWGSNVKHTNNSAPSPTISSGTSTQYFLRWNGTVWQCTMSNTGVPTS